MIKSIEEILNEHDYFISRTVGGEFESEWTTDNMKDVFRKDVANIVRALAKEMREWTKRPDDAERIPDVLFEKADEIENYKGLQSDQIN